MWEFIEEKEGILYFSKGEITRNTVGIVSDVDSLITQWNAEDAITEEETE